MALIDPKGKPWNNVAYQTCMGIRVQRCGEEYYATSSKQPAATEVSKCMEMYQPGCIKAGEASNKECEAKQKSQKLTRASMTRASNTPFRWLNPKG